MSTITLLTDFGVEDEYVGIMKGVILSVNPAAVIVDISHHIDPQDVIQAAYTIKYAYKYFSKGSIHIIIVDPGVGSDRAIVAVKMMGYVFLAPDNGVLSFVMDEGDVDSIVRIDNSNYFLNPVSRTFHGRDIFAPVGAHISMGVEIKELGTPIDRKDLVRIDVQKPRISAEGELVGTIVSVDRFGNLITDIECESIEKFCKPDRKLQIITGNIRITGLSRSYGSVDSQSPLAIIGSRGYLEIAVNQGSAGRSFVAGKGDTVRLIPGQ
ncbi:MAG: SAM-dependent chlorinase/fluorinase [Thermodesulfobacteriota bacterium]|nr:SAM-dependent chlorinase/fluorinase [Thermodesulfobacteriota bacterium]